MSKLRFCTTSDFFHGTNSQPEKRNGAKGLAVISRICTTSVLRFMVQTKCLKSLNFQPQKTHLHHELGILQDC